MDETRLVRSGEAACLEPICAPSCWQGLTSFGKVPRHRVQAIEIARISAVPRRDETLSEFQSAGLVATPCLDDRQGTAKGVAAHTAYDFMFGYVGSECRAVKSTPIDILFIAEWSLARPRPFV